MEAPLRWAPATRRRDGFDRFGDRGVDLALELTAIEVDGQAGPDLETFSSVGQETAGHVHCVGQSDSEPTRERPNQGDAVNAVHGDSARHSLPTTLDARKVEVRQEIVDPLRVGASRKGSYFNVIASQENYPCSSGTIWVARSIRYYSDFRGNYLSLTRCLEPRSRTRDERV